MHNKIYHLNHFQVYSSLSQVYSLVVLKHCVNHFILQIGSLRLRGNGTCGGTWQGEDSHSDSGSPSGSWKRVGHAKGKRKNRVEAEVWAVGRRCWVIFRQWSVLCSLLLSWKRHELSNETKNILSERSQAQKPSTYCKILFTGSIQNR